MPLAAAVLLTLGACSSSPAAKAPTGATTTLPSTGSTNAPSGAKRWPSSRCDIMPQAAVEKAGGIAVTTVRATVEGCQYLTADDAIDIEYYNDDSEFRIHASQEKTTAASGFGVKAYYSNEAQVGKILFVVLADGRSFLVGSNLIALEPLANAVIAAAGS